MTQRDSNGAEQVSLKVIIRQPAGNYNRYEWNEIEQALVMAERVWQAEHRLFEMATVPGTINQRGVALGVLIPADQSDSPGVVVKVRPVGLATVIRGVAEGEGLRSQHFLIAIVPVDPLYSGIKSVADLLPSWKEEVEHYLLLSGTDPETNPAKPSLKADRPAGRVSWQGVKEAWKVIGASRRAFRQAQVVSRGSGQTGPGWQLSEEELDDYLRGNLVKEDETTRHSAAENQLFQLPYRFQQHVARCLLPQARIVSWVFRPAFKSGWLWRRKQENDALFILTDRQLLWLTDTLPPGLTITDWGYRAASISLSKLAKVKLTGVNGEDNDLKENSSYNKQSAFNRNRPGKPGLELGTLGGVEFQFDFGSSEAMRKAAAYRKLIDLAEKLNEFVPDRTKAKLLRLFSFEQTPLKKETEVIKGEASPKDWTGIKRKPVETEEQLPTTLRGWLLAGGKVNFTARPDSLLF